jgi:Tol biopolymer transport system component
VRSRILLIVLGLWITALVPATTAGATYPGVADGRLAFGFPKGDFTTTDIYSVTPDGTGLRRLTDAPDFEACPSYSPDGKRIAYCRGAAAPTGVVEIWSMKQNGTHEHAITHVGGRATFPDYSPDGTRIAFMMSVPPTAQPDLYVIRADGSGLTRLTDDPAFDGYPAWSPDGGSLAFVSTRSGIGQVWVMDAGGSDPVQLTFDLLPKNQLPDWSPDGSRIAYHAGATGVGDIYVMDADGSDQTRLTFAAGSDLGPAWSPTGDRIAFLSTRNGSDRELFFMNPDGSDQRLIHAGDHVVPTWQSLFETE